MAVNFDAYSLGSFEWNNGSTGRTISHTCGGSNRYLFVDIRTDRYKDESEISAVTYNGVAMTLIVSLAGSVWRHWRYRLLAPDSGTYNVKVTFAASSTAQFRIAAQSCKDVDQTDPNGTTVTGTKSWGSGTMTLTATGVADGLLVDSACMYAQDALAGGSQTLTYSGVSSFKGSYRTGTGSTSTTWVYAGGSWEGTGIITPLKPVAVVAGGDFIALGRGLGRGLLRKAR